MIFAFQCSAIADYNSLETTHSCLSSGQYIDGKVYLEPSAICIVQDGLFLNFNGGLIPISFVAIDKNGFYTYWTGWTPCFDEDWRCEDGHWNPSYEDKCVTCRKPKQRNSPRWKDYK